MVRRCARASEFQRSGEIGFYAVRRHVHQSLAVDFSAICEVKKWRGSEEVALQDGRRNDGSVRAWISSQPGVKVEATGGNQWPGTCEAVRVSRAFSEHMKGKA